MLCIKILSRDRLVEKYKEDRIEARRTVSVSWSWVDKVQMKMTAFERLLFSFLVLLIAPLAISIKIPYKGKF